MGSIELIGSEALAETLRPLIPRHARIVVPALLGSGPDCAPAAVIVGLAQPDGEFLTTALSRLRRRNFLARTVVVAPFNRTHASIVARFAISAVVWLDDIRRDLPGVLIRILGDELRAHMETTLIELSSSDPLLAAVIASAFVEEERRLRVGELATMHYCSVATLRRHWSASRIPGTPRALRDWALLERYLRIRETVPRVSSVSRALSINPTTLHRVAVRRTGCTPGGLTATMVRAAFDTWADEG
jgi:hypothetical protein